MLENLINGTVFQKSLFVMIFGIVGVFFVLILFYIMIRLVTKLFPYKNNDEKGKT